jgi:hypothetical protein
MDIDGWRDRLTGKSLREGRSESGNAGYREKRNSHVTAVAGCSKTTTAMFRENHLHTFLLVF